MGDAAELTMLTDALRALLRLHWPVEQAITRAGDKAALRAVWQTLASQGFAALGADAQLGGLGAAALVVGELGRAACPAPFIPAFVANILGGQAPALAAALEAVGAAPLSLALGKFDGDRRAGGVTAENGVLDGALHFVEDLQAAEQLLVFTPAGPALIACNAAGLAVELTPGLAVPALAEVTLSAVQAQPVALPEAALADAAALVRILLVARALGAAQRGFELVTEYVQVRVQFGQPLGRFQSMQHKLADCSVTLRAAKLMLDAAAAAFDGADAGWRFLADALFAFSAGSLRKVSLETQHAFGAIGYAEAHEAPRHFRRVHADLARLGGQRRARAALAGHMTTQPGQVMPRRCLGGEAEAFRAKVQAWLAANWTASDRAAERSRPFSRRQMDAAFNRKLGADGWLSLAWPEAFGGKSLPPLLQLVLVEELNAAAAPFGGSVASAMLLAPEIIRHGSLWLQEQLLPGIRSGEFWFALGYSEPEAGSDLTALRTRAVRDGDYYIINGQKLWGTGTEHATHIVLAVRTDLDARSNAQGISVIIVPKRLQGITVHPHDALYGHTFCTQFFDDVRVPAGYLLGAENGGWSVLTGALAAERIQMGGAIVKVQKVFEQLCAHVANDAALRGDAYVLDMIGQYAAELEAARQLSLDSVRRLETGQMPLVEGAMTKVFSGDLSERISEAALDILGSAGLLGEDAGSAPLAGQIEQLLRRSVMLVIGGGAAEVQKTLIAQRGLRLPR